MSDDSKKIGLIGLIAMVIGSMIGGGIFNITQNMAQNSALGPVIIAWIITAVGMLALAFTFKFLSDQRPDLSNGIYSYAREGFGNYVGFNSAWGYWIASATGNVAFAVMLNDAVGRFYPVLLNHGWQTVVFGTVLIWFYNFLVLRGVKQAASINTITVVAKFITILVIIIAMIVFFNIKTFDFDIWGKSFDLGSIGAQVKAPMLVTLWCFIGIEGAVVISGRAKKPSQVGIATIIGFVVALLLYVILSVLAYGIMHQPELAKLTDPSTGYVLQQAAGGWFVDFVNIAVIISVGGAWVAWTILVAEVPYTAALDKNLPKIFARENDKQVPSAALYISSVVMTIFMILVVTAKNVYDAAIDITGVIILPSYLFSSMFLWKSAQNKTVFKDNSKRRNLGLFVGICSTIYCLWLLYAGGLDYLLITSVIYAIGIIFFWYARKEQKLNEPIFKSYEKWLAIILVILAIISIILIIMGKVKF
ncbi:basic amino acid/polyamine antiporter [Ornithobacterium rhinotracheale]|uniref:basic amino acid/polyamine antiporter n=1 Tax=Ornithobacterium rhinotracheale TaxID=28251 RepID=UPI0038739026